MNNLQAKVIIPEPLLEESANQLPESAHAINPFLYVIIPNLQRKIS